MDRGTWQATQSMELQEFDVTEQLNHHRAIYHHCLIYLP